jgi:lipid II:glycine glycyltransferase (peptidoglycan interpeptide bridge formation enzyme)
MVKILTTDEGLAGALPIVGTAPYLRAKAPRYGWFRGGDLVLPFLVERRALFHRLVFTHQTICLSGSCEQADEREFLDQVVQAARKLGVDFIYQPQATAVFSVVPQGAVYAPFGTYVVDLQLPVDQLWANVHGKHRNVIKKAKEAGVEITEGPHNLPICHELIQSTMKRNEKLSVSLGELERFRENLGENASFYVAKKDNVPQGAAVIVWNAGHTADYLHGGTSESPFGGGMNLLHWTAMTDMKARGVRYYDFVGARVSPPSGSKLETIQRFKVRFGATMRQGYLWKYPLKPLRYSAYRLFARANALMHGATYQGDIIDEERAYG